MDWQDIDSAPKDRSLVLVYTGPSRDQIHLARFDALAGMWFIGNTGHFLPIQPTFWHPIAPPEEPTRG